MEQKRLTIHIMSGEREVTLDSFSLAAWQTVIDTGKGLLCDASADANGIFMHPETGSVKAVFLGPVAAVAAAGSFLAAASAGQSLDGFPQRKVNALRGLQGMAVAEKYSIDIEAQDVPGGTLHLDAGTAASAQKITWYEDEINIYGKIIDAGGSPRPNIHLEVEGKGRVKIAISKELLEKEERNLLYRWVGVQTTLRRSLADHSWDPESLRAVRLLPYKPGWRPGEVEALIGRLEKTWRGVNADQWLAEVRGR